MKMSMSQVCNISLKSSVLLHPMTTKCSHGHDNVCANLNATETKLKLIIFFLLVIFLIKKYPVFIILFDKIGLN